MLGGLADGQARAVIRMVTISLVGVCIPGCAHAAVPAVAPRDGRDIIAPGDDGHAESPAVALPEAGNQAVRLLRRLSADRWSSSRPRGERGCVRHSCPGRASSARRPGSRQPLRPGHRRRMGRRVGCSTGRLWPRRRPPSRPLCGCSSSWGRTGRACRAGTLKLVSFMPSGAKMRSRRNSSSGWPEARAIRTPKHIGAGVIHPLLAWLGHQRQRPQAADPLVRLRRRRGAGIPGPAPDRSRREWDRRQAARRPDQSPL